ncbi:MAG: S41 family peptidase [Longimicrobiales bacterium]|nr:S41 family peptidase [Longimicrobiales bacterium]
MSRRRRLTVRGRGSALGLLLLAAVASGLAAQEVVRERTVYEDLQLFSQVLNQIRVNHPDTVDTHVLFMEAIEAMVRAADPHSYVIPAARLSPDRERALREGDLVPVPLAFRYVGGTPVVVSVAPGSRAVAAGIVPGDELVAIDGEPVRAATARELDLVLAGPEDSEVVLTFRRLHTDGSTVRVDRTVVRERVDPTGGVTAVAMLDTVTGYVRVTTFAAEQVAADLDDALDRLEDRGMTGLVLDLRDNGGGLVREAASAAGAFLPRGAIVYTTTGRKEEVVDTGRVRRSFWRSERGYPVVVLVNEGTASAAELVAGALQDHDRALVVGRPTFGKALIMQPFPLTDGSLMVLVIGKVHTPCGRTVQREYRAITSDEYYRAAAEERERIGRETCTTAGGRTVYGGGGIYPDHVLEDHADPHWVQRIRDENLLLRWVPGFLDDRPDRYANLPRLVDEPALESEDVAAFVAYAAEQGVEVPRDPEATARLERLVLSRIILSRFGHEGLYAFLAHTDPEVEAAARLLPEAAALLGDR